MERRDDSNNNSSTGSTSSRQLESSLHLKADTQVRLFRLPVLRAGWDTGNTHAYPQHAIQQHSCCGLLA